MAESMLESKQKVKTNIWKNLGSDESKQIIWEFISF